MIQMLAACRPVRPVSLEWLLRLSSRFESTDLRDKIYALLGLVCDKHRAFIPDYKKPLSLVLQDLVRFLIQASENLNILSGNRFGTNSDGPSWVPCLSQQMHIETALSVQDSPFTASNNWAPRATFDISSGTMSVKGLLVGKVKTVIGPFKPATQLPTDPEGIQAEAKRLGHHQLMQDFKTFGRGLDPENEDMFWRTLVMNQDISNMENAKSAPEEFGHLYRVFIGKQPVPMDFLPNAPIGVRIAEFSRPFHTTMDQTTASRSFFTTDCSRMGLGPYCTQAEDIIVVLLGSSVCHVLRETESHYTLIGDAYVHNIMGGELVRDRVDEEFHDFVLR